MATRRRYDWPPDDELVEFALRFSTLSEAAKEMDVAPGTLRSHLADRNLTQRVAELRKRSVETPEGGLSVIGQGLLDALKKRKATYSVEDLADAQDVSPKRVREALEELREKGYRVPDEQEALEGKITLQRVAPAKDRLHRSLLEGDELRIGVVSDTHLCSNEEALRELELAYDVFEREGIREVLHAGDLVAGRGIFRTQDSEIKHHTLDAQVKYAIENYPRREGIVTRMIGGNHDLEGDAGKVGFDPVQAVANVREDIDYLGPYSAWVELPNGGWVHLLHGKGGGSYAFSYQAQKLCDGYPAGTKPAVLIVGHFHRKGNIEQRGVEVIWPGCFEWKSPFMARLGLAPTVGFYILNLTLGPDGSLVRFVPEWLRFFEGRTVE